MESSPDPKLASTDSIPWKTFLRNTAYILFALLIFLFALELMLASLQALGRPAAETIILATSNPFTALFIGLLITAIIQSSTATTSMTVALVASGSLTLESAVPIVMGANIGTTITSTIVSLGFIPRKKEFRRAVAAGTYHDFFNILTATILFPLEYYFQLLSYVSRWLANTFFNQPLDATTNTFSLFGGAFSRINGLLTSTIDNGFLLIALSLVILFSSIFFFRRVLTRMLGFGVPDRFQRFFFRSPIKSFSWGVLTTAAIRSSTVTTSLVVPLVAKRVVKLRGAVPFILGANIGTTISAFVAALLNSNAAISIAISHFLFNLIGVIIFSFTPAVKELPVRLAKRLGQLTMKYRMAGLLYLLLTFFIIPFSLIYFNRDAVTVTELTYERTLHDEKSTFTVIAKTFKNQLVSTWSEYRPGTEEAPSLIYSVYRKGNLLIINHELFELNRPGFCKDGEDQQGKFKLCIKEVVPRLEMSSSLALDSVFVFYKEYDNRATPSVISYISAPANLFVKKEVRDSTGQIISMDALSRVVRK